MGGGGIIQNCPQVYSLGGTSSQVAQDDLMELRG